MTVQELGDREVGGGGIGIRLYRNDNWKITKCSTNDIVSEAIFRNYTFIN